MLEFCHERDAYVQFQDTLFAQVQALICNGKPIGGLVIDANKYFDKAKAEMVSIRANAYCSRERSWLHLQKNHEICLPENRF